MKLSGPGRKTKPLVKGLMACCIFTLLLSLLCSAWFSMTSNYSAMIHVEDIELIQFDAPEKGDTIAVIHTTAGDMTYRLFPEQCPETVRSFTALAENGAYNDTFVFRVEPEIFFSAGAADTDGNVKNADAECERIPQELSPKLWPFRGSLCALTTTTDSGFFKTLLGKQKTFTGSRFLVADTIEMTDEIKEGLVNDESNEGQKLIGNAFIEHGGIPNYSQQITVFGQLIEGSEILDAITSAEVTGEENAKRPVQEIRITSIEIGKYGE